MQGIKRKLYRRVPPLSLIIAIIIGWEFAVKLLHIREYLLPPPSSIFSELVQRGGPLLGHTWVTLYESLAGFALSLVVGIPLAIAIVFSPYLRDSLYPILLFFQSVPKVAIAPIVLVWFGYGILPKVFIAFLITFFPIVINTATGMVQVEPDLMHLINSLSASRLQIFTKVRLPNSLPYLFSAMKISITLAIVGAIIGEFVGAEKGLGFQVLHAGVYINTPLQFACFFILAFLGIALFALINVLEKTFMPWLRREESMRAAAA